MSDLISRSAVIDIIHKEIQRTTSWVEHDTQINIKFAIEELPTVEAIPKEKLDKIVERLEKKINPLHNVNWNSAIEEAIEIVKGVMNERD